MTPPRSSIHGVGRMRVFDLQRTYDYHYWATRRVLDAVGGLTREELTQVVAGSDESVRDTLVHVMSTEWGWLARCGGAPRARRLDPERYPTVSAVRDSWSRIEQMMRGFLATLGDADLARGVAVDVAGAPSGVQSVGDLLQHAALDAMHHRGQVALMLRMLDVTPRDFDLLSWLGERTAIACAPLQSSGRVRRLWTLPAAARRES